MKKTMTMLCSLLLVLSMMTACGKTDVNNNGVPDGTITPTAIPQTTDRPNGSDESITSDIKDGVDKAADDVQRGMNDAKNKIDSATNDMMGR